MRAPVWLAMASIVSGTRQALGAPDAGVVEDDDPVVLGQGVDKDGVPILHRPAPAGDHH